MAVFYFLSLFSGIIVSVMVAFNGVLAEQYGAFSSTVIIHIIGLFLITVILLIKRGRPFAKKHEWYLYLGGAVGVMSTALTNIVFSLISVSAILAMGLFAQSLTGLIIDQYGLLGMPKYPFRKRKITGLIVIMCGIASMMDIFDFVSVLLAFLPGVGIIVSRTLNAKLAERTSVSVSTFFNYAIGLIVSVPLFILLGRNELIHTQFVLSPKIYIYFGGICGVIIVLICNLIVMKISAFYLSLFSFIGQVFTGIVIDIMISGEFSPQNLIGGILVTAGLCINLLLDKQRFNPADDKTN